MSTPATNHTPRRTALLSHRPFQCWCMGSELLATEVSYRTSPTASRAASSHQRTSRSIPSASRAR